MLGALDFNFIDIVSPFLGGLVDSLCGLRETGETTISLTSYVDMVNVLFTRHMSFELGCEVHTGSPNTRPVF